MAISDGEFDEYDGSRASASSKKGFEKSRTPVIDNFCRDFTKVAFEGGGREIIAGRGKELAQISTIIELSTLKNILLVEEPGMEAENVLKFFALNIAKRKGPLKFRNYRIVFLDPCEVTSIKTKDESSIKGKVAERQNVILKELKFAIESLPVLYLGNLYNALKFNSFSKDFTKSLIASSVTRFICTIERSQLDNLNEEQQWINNKFTIIYLKPLTESEIKQQLNDNIDLFGELNQVELSKGAIDAIVNLSKLHNPIIEEPLRSKQLMEEVCSFIRLNNQNTPKHIESLEKEIEDIKERKNIAVRSQNYEHAAALREQESLKQRILEQEAIILHEEEKLKRYPVSEVDVLNVVSTFKGYPIEYLKKLLNAPASSSSYTQNDANKILALNLNDIPDSIKTAFQQYILYFKDYLSKVKGEDIFFEVHKTIDGLRLDIKPSQIDDMEDFNRWFNEYLNYIKIKDGDFSVNFERKIEDSEANVVMTELRSQIRFMETQLEIGKLKTNQLEQENIFLKRLALNNYDYLSTVSEDKHSEKEPNNTQFKNKLINLLTDGAIKEALTELNSFLQPGSMNHDELILIRSRLSSAEREHNTGQITNKEFRIECQNIAKAILSLIKSILA